MGVLGWLEGQGQWARLCRRKISDSIFWLFYFTPRWLVGVMPCPRKSQKELYERKDRNRKETKTFLLYFPLFTGFNNLSMDEGVFPEYIEMVESPS